LTTLTAFLEARMTKPIRWGILATGWIAERFTDDLKLLDGALVTAVGSRSDESAERFAAAYAIPHAHGSWQALADDPDVDVVYVATPHSAHYEATKLCLAAGKAVLCEKPFTLDTPTAQELVDLATADNLFLMEAMWTRTNPAIRRMLELVADGAIGEVTSVEASFGVQGPFEPSHRLRDPKLGGGALLDLGVYPLTVAHIFLGDPSEIRAWASLYPEGTDANTGIVLGHPSGAVATLHCGSMGESAQRATVVGTHGRFEIPQPFFTPDRFTMVRRGDAEEISMPLRGHGMGYEAEEVMRCLREGLLESPLVSHEITLAMMRTCDIIREQIGVSYT
jgi:predicted dehydrogenase